MEDNRETPELTIRTRTNVLSKPLPTIKPA